MSEQKMKPLFKYIGGKSWLRDELRMHVVESLQKTKITTYAEPFAGGLGSFLNVYDLLLENNIKDVILSDINEALIYTYNAIKYNHQNFIYEFLLIENQFSQLIDSSWKEKSKNDIKICLKNAEIFFNIIKKEFNLNKNKVDIRQSAKLVFLQKHSFNGIYRENLKGEYNTPFNWSGSNMIDTIEDKVNEIHNLFNKFNLTFITQSFENIDYNNNTLYYLDPPYLNDSFGENKYNKSSFNISQQILLINKIKDFNFIYSNHKSDLLIKEFENIKDINIKEIARKNIMSSNSESRKKDKIEILISHHI
ncbi:Dam family site-specific DNA-(adenine-N6)-methyltransferase [archaeon]|nr:Dam family site-specific DNA-(adenine-N6)-methyltransferase [archaeon]